MRIIEDAYAANEIKIDDHGYAYQLTVGGIVGMDTNRPAMWVLCGTY